MIEKFTAFEWVTLGFALISIVWLIWNIKNIIKINKAERIMKQAIIESVEILIECKNKTEEIQKIISELKQELTMANIIGGEKNAN
jgi:hypothetical protein